MEANFIYRPPNWDFHVFSFLKELESCGIKFKQHEAILNDSWTVNLRESGAGKCIPIPTVGPTMRFTRYGPLSLEPLDPDAIDPPNGRLPDPVWIEYQTFLERHNNLQDSLRQSQYEYNKRRFENNIMENKMFNKDEVNFINETAKKDLTAVNSKIENMVDELARLGKNLSEMKTVKKKLQGIVSSIEDNEKLHQNRFGTMAVMRGCC